MPQKPTRRLPVNGPVAQKRPIKSANVAQNARQFPDVGMTLRSYQYDPRDHKGRAGWKRTEVKTSRWQRLKQRITRKRAIIGLAIILLVGGGWVGGKFLYNAHKLFGGNIFGILRGTKLDGESEGRVNILMAGNSADDKGHNGGSLTDSIMLISIDTKTKRAFMLSIPRDLWVEVGDDGHQKINGAYVVGEANDFEEEGYPKGGMGQLEQVVSDSLGLPIHYYALVDYTALKQAVDAVGGVDITIKSEDPRGLYDPNIDFSSRAHGPLVKLSNGVHHLNGQQALNLARARGDSAYSYGYAGSDFTRTEHQRQLVVALKNKAVSAGTLANPAKLTSLFDAVGNNVETDFEISEVRRLADLMKEIPNNRIKSLSLNEADGKSLLASYQSPAGQSALIPAAGLDDFSDIQAFINKQTSSSPVVQESARVVVLNGTNINGLASRIKHSLLSKQINVDDIGDAGNAGQVTTAIINLAGDTKPATKAALVKQFGSKVTTQNPYGDAYDVDFIIVVGSDQTKKTESSNP
jgi:polyisoprenyl-teichoic acid--peptidoglycan teichoic acid transferase